MFHSVDPTLLVRGFLANLGLSAGTISWMSTLIMVLAVFIIAWLSKIFAKLVIMRVVTFAVKRSKSTYDDKFLETRMFQRLAWIVPGLVVYFMASWLLQDSLGWLTIVHKTTEVYIVVLATLSLSSFVEGWHQVYLMQPIAGGRSIKPYVQVVKVLLIFAAALVIASVLFRVPFNNVITGLGVATAVLAVVFKDTILGLVASIQLSTNHMIQLGDWITIPGRNIDGTVKDITLYTVKVENFDKTIMTVPTYALISRIIPELEGNGAGRGETN